MESTMQIKGVDCLVRNTPLDKDENILDLLLLHDIEVIAIEIHLRNKVDCPFNRGNWIIDLTFKDGSMVCLKLNKDISENDVMNYCKPLIDKIQRTKNV